MSQKLKPWKPDGLHLQCVYVGYGVLLYTAFATNNDIPLGATWVRMTSNDFGQAAGPWWIDHAPDYCPACRQFYGQPRAHFCSECCPFWPWLWWKLRPLLDWLIVILAWIVLMAFVFVAWQ